MAHPLRCRQEMKGELYSQNFMESPTEISLQNNHYDPAVVLNELQSLNPSRTHNECCAASHPSGTDWPKALSECSDQ